MRCLLTAQKDTTPPDCAIFHCPTSEVSIPDLPCTWTLHGCEYDTLTLPCGHHFNPSAITLHFLLADMRCPVCRQGHDVRMNPSCIPKSLRHAFENKQDSVQSRDEQETSLVDILHNISVDMTDYEGEFGLVVDLTVRGQTCVLLQTPIRPLFATSTDTYVPFRTQQSFQRMLNQQFQRHAAMDNVVVTFSIQHPVLFLPVQTESLAFSQLVSIEGPRALPFRVMDVEEEQVVGSLICSGVQREGVQQINLFLDRDVLVGLCLQCIQTRLQQLIQQQLS